PSAYPCTPAIVGYAAYSSHEYANCVRRIASAVGSSCVDGPSTSERSFSRLPVKTDVSMPEENARPSPTTISARNVGSSTSPRPSAAISRHILIVNELSLSGRLSRNHPISPISPASSLATTRSKRSVSYCTSDVVTGERLGRGGDARLGRRRAEAHDLHRVTE